MRMAGGVPREEREPRPNPKKDKEKNPLYTQKYLGGGGGGVHLASSCVK